MDGKDTLLPLARHFKAAVFMIANQGSHGECHGRGHFYAVPDFIFSRLRSEIRLLSWAGSR